MENTRIEKFYAESGDMIIIYYTLPVNTPVNVCKTVSDDMSVIVSDIKEFYKKNNKDVLVLAIPQYIN